MLRYFSINSFKGRLCCGLCLMLLCFLLVNSVIGQVSDTSQYQNPSIKTSNGKKVVKIEYSIDKLTVENNELLSTLKKMTHIAVGSQFSRYAVQRSVISLYTLKQFYQVDVYVLDAPGGIMLKFDLLNMMQIQKINITGFLTDELREAIRDAVKLRPGDMYDPVIAKIYVRSIKAVCADDGYFSADVRFNVIPTDGSLTYQIDLRTPTLVSELQIQGNSAIFTEQIKEICQTRIGKVYRKSIVDEDFLAIRDLYRKKYYPSTEIESTFAYKSGLLTLDITEGIQLLLDFVDENGKPIIRESPISNFLANLGFNRQESEKDQLSNKITLFLNDQSRWVQTVEAHFAAKGYDGTKVEMKKLTNSPLHVKFIINPGIRYIVKNVEFIGNEAFIDKDLLREMETKPSNFFSQHIRRRFFSGITVERDKKSLEILYEKAGYRDVLIKYELEKHNPNNRNVGEISIKLTFSEPYKEVIYRCHFAGNSVLKTSALFDALPSKPPAPNALLVQKNYENAILKTYQDRGYIEAKIKNTNFLQKTENPVFQIEGNFTKQLDAGTVPGKLSDTFKKHSLSLAGTFIATKIGNEWIIQDVDGNARYTLKQEKEQLAVFEHGVLRIEIDEGNQVVFGNFHFTGDTGVKQNILRREVAHLPGTLFTFEKLSRAIQNLYNTGIFEPGIRAKPIGSTGLEEQSSNFDKDISSTLSPPHPIIKDVEIRLQKQKPGTYGASAGTSSSDGLRGTVALSHRNLFKRNVRFRLRGRQGTLGYLYDTTLTEPWLIGRTSGSLQFLVRKLEEDEDVRALQGSFTLSRKLPKAHQLNLEYSYRDLKDTSESTLISNPSTTVSSLRFSWRQDSRFPSLNPTSGMLNEVTLEYAGGYLGGESSFIKTIADTRYHRKLNERGFVLATALRFGITTGLLQANRETELISFERFWAGGSTTVRGYEDRGLGPKDITGKHRGNVQFIFNTELRFPILDPFQGVLFFDTGNVWDTFKDIEYDWLPSAVGAGLRLNLGPLSFGVDYAFPLVTVPDVPTNSFYFRVGSTF